MTIKLSSVVVALVFMFIAKISFEAAVGEKNSETPHERTTASIDKSYQDHMNRR
jgi:hypothetical protein